MSNYGLPGLRLGWMVAPADVIQACWRRHEYAAIAATIFSMKLADYALVETAGKNSEPEPKNAYQTRL